MCTNKKNLPNHYFIVFTVLTYHKANRLEQTEILKYKWIISWIEILKYQGINSWNEILKYQGITVSFK